MKRFMTVVVMGTLAGLLSVYTEVEAVKIGYTIRKQEETRTLLLDRSRALKYNIARLKAPHNLERRLSAQRIELQEPASWNTLVLPGRTVRKDAAKQGMLMQPFALKFFVGTARAEAKESASR
ncbi:MAG: hypothetical protein MOGMAGMI_01241 [Candidatus Omnitrophica bacterium]|nr:hypothetical protein [Candidatus Omnitrophota bacterium]